MFFSYKPTKFRTHSRLAQSPRKKIKAPVRKHKLIRSVFGHKSLVRT